MNSIDFYNPKEHMGEFSNYFKSPINIDGKYYETVEHYFQSQKFPNTDYSEIIRTQNTPNKAKILASQKRGGGYKWRTDLNSIIDSHKHLVLREDWEEVKDSIMFRGLQAKFKTKEFKNILQATGDKEIREVSPRDYYWGTGKNGTGLNKLGKLLMKLRNELVE